MLTLVHAIVAGGSHIDHADVLRCGGTARVLPFRVMAPSTLGTFLRSFSFGHVRQLEAVVGETFPVEVVPADPTAERRDPFGAGSPGRCARLPGVDQLVEVCAEDVREQMASLEVSEPRVRARLVEVGVASRG